MNCPKCGKEMLKNSFIGHTNSDVMEISKMYPIMIIHEITYNYKCLNCFNVEVGEKEFKRYVPEKE